jgi:3',5'-cyclic-AMP phosphodiesterase
VHIGDLHVSSEDGYESAEHFARLVSVVNEKVANAVDFAYLPGDNANNGTPEQYARIRALLSDLHLPTNAIPGDHDFEPGSLSAFQAFHRGLKTPALPRKIQVHGHGCLFLDIVSAGKGGPDFCLGRGQTEWVDQQLQLAFRDRERPIVFIHAYPGDLAEGGEAPARSLLDAPLGTDAHAIGEWREHGLLGSQLGPNKNGRAW